ncbi:MAG: hypothetical protein IT336_03025 [Thermomicrobiales bacterium]|nr:hypothetical protein [Thermomicrobiales bacterium]
MRRIGRSHVLLLLLAIGSLTAIPAFAQVDESASPASSHAQVVAQGVATLPVGDIVWQVEQLETGSEAGADVSGPAFILTSEAGVLVSEPARSLDVRLAPGESHFVHADALATVWSLSDDDATFQVWSLVAPGDASDEALFVSDPFAAPAGERDLNLVRDVLEPNDVAQIGNGEVAALILATGGPATVVNGGGEPVELADGVPTIQTGPLTITAAGDAPITVVAGLIGPAVTEPDVTPTAGAPEGGVIKLVTYACPAGIDVAAATPATCDGEPGAGSWTLYGGNLENPAAPAPQGAAWLWQGLEPGDYRIVLDQYPEAYARFAIDLYDFAGRDGSEINLTLTDDLLDVTINAYFIDPQETGEQGSGGAALGFTFYDCPPETTTEDLSGLTDPGCTERDQPFAMTLESDELPAALTSAVLIQVSPQPSTEGSWRWIDLPVGDYTLTIDEQASGDAFYVQRPCGDESCPETGGLGVSFDLAIDDGGFMLIVYRIPES